MKCIVDDDVVLSRPLEGPLSGYIGEFAKWTREEGYAFLTRQWKVMLAARFSLWLKRQAASIRCVSLKHATRYLRCRARHVLIKRGDYATLRQFIDLLRRQGVEVRSLRLS